MARTRKSLLATALLMLSAGAFAQPNLAWYCTNPDRPFTKSGSCRGKVCTDHYTYVLMLKGTLSGPVGSTFAIRDVRTFGDVTVDKKYVSHSCGFWGSADKNTGLCIRDAREPEIISFETSGLLMKFGERGGTVYVDGKWNNQPYTMQFQHGNPCTNSPPRLVR